MTRVRSARAWAKRLLRLQRFQEGCVCGDAAAFSYGSKDCGVTAVLCNPLQDTATLAYGRLGHLHCSTRGSLANNMDTVRSCISSVQEGCVRGVTAADSCGSKDCGVTAGTWNKTLSLVLARHDLHIGLLKSLLSAGAASHVERKLATPLQLANYLRVDVRQPSCGSSDLSCGVLNPNAVAFQPSALVPEQTSQHQLPPCVTPLQLANLLPVDVRQQPDEKYLDAGAQAFFPSPCLTAAKMILCWFRHRNYYFEP